MYIKIYRIFRYFEVCHLASGKIIAYQVTWCNTELQTLISAWAFFFRCSKRREKLYHFSLHMPHEIKWHSKHLRDHEIVVLLSRHYKMLIKAGIRAT